MDVFLPLNRCVFRPGAVLLHHNISRDALYLKGQVPARRVKNGWCIQTHTKTHMIHN